jgi:hypothetical protein
MKPTLALAFSGALGVLVGGGGVSLVDSQPYTPASIPSSARATLLSAAAAQRFVPLSSAHVTEVEVVLRGIQSAEDPNVWFPQTHAWVSAPPVVEGRAAFRHEHWSLTNSAAMPGILALVEQVILPAAAAQCPDLADADAYPLRTEHVESAGVRGSQAVARIVVPSVVEGLPPVTCSVSAPAPPEALAGVVQMLDGFVVPAVKAETGLR